MRIIAWSTRCVLQIPNLWAIFPGHHQLLRISRIHNRTWNRLLSAKFVWYFWETNLQDFHIPRTSINSVENKLFHNCRPTNNYKIRQHFFTIRNGQVFYGCNFDSGRHLRGSERPQLPRKVLFRNQLQCISIQWTSPKYVKRRLHCLELPMCHTEVT